MVLLVLATGNGWRTGGQRGRPQPVLPAGLPLAVRRLPYLRVDRRLSSRRKSICGLTWTTTRRRPPGVTPVLCPDVHLADRVRRCRPASACAGAYSSFPGDTKPPLPIDSRYMKFMLRFNDAWLTRPTRSRFVLAAPGDARKWESCQLRLLEELRGGSLYLNLDFQDNPPAPLSTNVSSVAGSYPPP